MARLLVPILLEKPEPGGKGRRGPRRRWTVHLAPKLPTLAFEGYVLLDELPGAEAGALVPYFRDALLWSMASRSDRDALFWPRASEWSPGKALLRSLAPALDNFDKLSSDPAHVNSRELARACTLVAEWAATAGYPQTEYYFSALAAYAFPRDPMLAFAAGRAARRHSRTEDARGWFRRAIGLARRLGDDAAYASAFLGWAILEERQGNRAEAVAKFSRAWKAAKRGKLRELAAAARHNMLAIALAERNFAQGQAHLVSAYKLYGQRNPQLYRLANDAAGFWSAFGYYAIALPSYEAALPYFRRADERMAVLANISRAAAALGDRDRYLDAWDRALDLDREAGEALPEIYVELARGAHDLGIAARAKELATKAVEAAERRGVEASISNAQRVLADVLSGAPADEPCASEPELQRFATRFRARLRELPG